MKNRLLSYTPVTGRRRWIGPARGDSLRLAHPQPSTRSQARRATMSPWVRLPYQPCLDGLRGIAVLAVLAFHMGVRGTEGGFLCVDIFFVLSGFLITTLLVGEWERNGTIHLSYFYARRALRLLPALLVLLAVYLLIDPFFQGVQRRACLHD